jgi:prefoldin beta subunit
MSEIEEIFGELQMQNQQLQTITMQRQSLLIQQKEMEKALEEVEKTADEDIYRSVGPILVKTSKETIKKELEEGKEDADLKLKSLEKQEARIKQKIKTMQERFQSLAENAKTGG